ncbi:MAG: RIP metalloprotease RseP [Pseudomonadota bacterium]
MDLIAQIPLIGGTLAIIIPFLIVLSVVVFVHEYGHYIVGRWCGIGAQVFSVGFGKPLLGWTDKRGTRWQIAALPLGGFVKFTGDMDPASAGRADDATLSEAERASAFHNAALWKRAITVFAGPGANFLLSIVLFAAIALAVGKASNEPIIAAVDPEAAEQIGFQAGDRVLSVGGEEVEDFAGILNAMHRADGETLEAVVERGGARVAVDLTYGSSPRIDTIAPGMPAAQAGIAPGDRVVSIDGIPVRSFYQMQVITNDLEHGAPVELVVLRGARELTFTFVPEIIERNNPVTGEVEPLPTFGVRSNGNRLIEAPMQGVGFGEAGLIGVSKTWEIVTGTVTFIGDMVFANADTSQLGGPIRIAEISGERAEQGVGEFIFLIALLSTSIGLLNLFPIPVLDGGHLMFYAAEAVRGRPIGERWLAVGNMIGLSLVLSLMVFVTYNDIARFWAG